MIIESCEFVPFKKIPRLSREVTITEKLDGTNAHLMISDDGKSIVAASRNRYLDIDNDNHGFAAFVEENREELLTLGPGRHYGEWWGKGINRNYGVDKKYFSLFNVKRWRGKESDLPSNVLLVPVLYRGLFDTQKIDDVLANLGYIGSIAAPGFMNPEGIVIYHEASGQLFKKTLADDGIPKSKVDTRV